MEKKLFKKIALFLVFAMLVGLMPMNSAKADGEDPTHSPIVEGDVTYTWDGEVYAHQADGTDPTNGDSYGEVVIPEGCIFDISAPVTASGIYVKGELIIRDNDTPARSGSLTCTSMSAVDGAVLQLASQEKIPAGLTVYDNEGSAMPSEFGWTSFTYNSESGKWFANPSGGPSEDPRFRVMFNNRDGNASVSLSGGDKYTSPTAIEDSTDVFYKKAAEGENPAYDDSNKVYTFTLTPEEGTEEDLPVVTSTDNVTPSAVSGPAGGKYTFTVTTPSDGSYFELYVYWNNDEKVWNEFAPGDGEVTFVYFIDGDGSVSNNVAVAKTLTQSPATKCIITTSSGIELTVTPNEGRSFTGIRYKETDYSYSAEGTWSPALPSGISYNSENKKITVSGSIYSAESDYEEMNICFSNGGGAGGETKKVRLCYNTSEVTLYKKNVDEAGNGTPGAAIANDTETDLEHDDAIGDFIDFYVKLPSNSKTVTRVMFGETNALDDSVNDDRARIQGAGPQEFGGSYYEEIVIDHVTNTGSVFTISIGDRASGGGAGGEGGEGGGGAGGEGGDPNPGGGGAPTDENAFDLTLFAEFGGGTSLDDMIALDVMDGAQKQFSNLMIQYSYDNSSWTQLLLDNINATAANENVDPDTKASYSNDKYTFTDTEHVYLKVTSNPTSPSYTDAVMTKEVDDTKTDLSLNTSFELVKGKNVNLLYNNHFYSLDWSCDSHMGEDAIVTHGSAAIKKLGSNVVTLSEVSREQGGGGGYYTTYTYSCALGNGDEDANGGSWRIKAGTVVTVKLAPDYGYQIKSASLNGVTLTPQAEVSTFTFTMDENNLHFAAVFTAVANGSDISTEGIIAAGVACNQGNVVNSGTLLINVDSMSEASDKDSMDSAAAEEGAEVKKYLSLGLTQQVRKGGEGAGYWEAELSELSHPVNVSLKVAPPSSGKKYSVIREHNGVYTKLEAVYDTATGMLSFGTNQFSDYALVESDIPAPAPEPSYYEPVATPEPTLEPTPEPEPTPEVKESSDGTKTTTSVTVDEDGTTTVEKTVEKPDGSVKTTTSETAADGTETTTVVEVEADGTATETVKTVGVNEEGNKETVKTTTTTDAEGNVTGVTEKTVIEDEKNASKITVTVKENGDGVVESSKATVSRKSSSKEVSLSGDLVKQISETAGTDTTITLKVKDEKGKSRFSLTANTEDLKAGSKTILYKLDKVTGELVCLADSEYTVGENGDLDLNINEKGSFELLNPTAAKKAEKAIVKSVQPESKKVTSKAGDKIEIKLDDKLNMANVSSIKYSSSDKSLAKIDKSGNLTARKKGKTTISITVTLNNGREVTVKTTVTIK